ncbi:MAG: TolC family protein [Candidatus Glassbacteria bacterium]|nr:TolC family protein [Candidatus Glassbacteria bacterium]
MNLKMRIAGLILCLTPATAQLAAQLEPVDLTVDDAIELALERGYRARVERLNLIRAEQLVKASKGRFRTQITMQLNAPDFQESVQPFRIPNEVPYYNTTGRLRWQSRLTITQPLPTDGRISLNSNLYQTRESVFRDQLNTTDKDKRFYTSLRLELRQPLFVPNTLKLGLERANLQHELAQRDFTRTELDVVYQVTESFFNLYRTKRELEIAREEVEQQQESYNLAQRKFEAGLIPEVDALQMEVDLAQSRNNMLSAEGSLSQQEDLFKLTVGLPLEERVDVTTELRIRRFEVDQRQAVEHGLAYRSEIREREINRRLAEITLEQTDAQSAISGVISAYYDLTGVSDPLLDYGSSVSRLFRSSIEDLKQRPKNRGVTFTLSLPIWDSGVNRAEVAEARATLQVTGLSEEEERRRVTREIRAVITRLKETLGRLDVLRQSEEVALRGYEISQARFVNGDITSQDLALNRVRLTNARQNYLSAFIAYQLAVADLKRNTLYDWENGRSLVEDAS